MRKNAEGWCCVVVFCLITFISTRVMERANLEKLKRVDLQKIAKLHGIKANKKNADMIKELLEIDVKTVCNLVSNEQKQNDEPTGTKNISQDCGYIKMNSEIQEEKPITIESSSEIKEKPILVAATNSDTVDSNKKESSRPSFGKLNSSAKRPLLQKEKRCSSSSNKFNNNTANKSEQVKDSKQSRTLIPKKLNSSAQKKKINWDAIHKNCFDKMESIGDYIEKKQQRREHLKSILKTVTQDAQTVLTEMKNAHNTPNASKAATPAGKNPVSQLKRTLITPKISTATPSSPKTVTKTPKAGIPKRSFQPPSSLAKCDKKFTFGRQSSSSRKSNGHVAFNASSNLSKKSNRMTCFDFRSPVLKPINNLNTTVSTPGKKFDLKESLKKPLSYKPHVGKIKSFEERYINKEQTVEKRRVDVKTMHKRQTRDDRRTAVRENRKATKANAFNKRRGIDE